MKIKYILSVIAIVAFTKNSFAQYSQDAIRFSTGSFGSTSRIKAVGNAGTALGGDLSNITGNPAGLGFFTRSEVSITPEFDGAKTKATYFGQATTDTKNSGNLNHAALVIYNQLAKARGADKTKGWLSVNYGVAFARTNNFYSNINYKGVNNSNSVNDYFADQANQFGLQQGSLGDMAYQQHLIDQYDAGTTPPSTVFASNAFPGVNQESVIERSGGLSSVDFSLGANYSNKFYLGLALSFTDLRYNSYSTFYEDGSLSTADGADPVDFSSAYSQNQITRGTGFGARLGAIYKPVEALRLGVTVSSPTFYNIDDTYNEGISSRINSGSTARDNSGDYNLNYNMRTPWKLAGGAAVFIKNIGFITGDVEYIDYSTAHLSSNQDYNADYIDNPDIKSLYRSTVNAHIGAEIKATNFFSLRGGYGIMGNPMKDNDNDIKTVSGGVGLRFGSYYVDATYTHSTNNLNVFPYDLGTASPSAALRNSNNNAYLTLGYRF
ncbi:OmpP1/FadL family transporter [Mucilaginibacter litoreus]|uniref:OmpP1/FadL family transporter n=1 Tax=Mucilaginibacter litoreus TaxID=1048221 RepID=A0ABW3AN34_9SPHI